MYGASAVNRDIADSCGQRLPEGLWFAPPASTPVFPLAEKGIAAFPDNPVNPVILSKKEIDRITGLTGLTSIIHPFHPVILSKKNPGFTLVELLVALSIFSILMTALVIIFVGALRTTQTGYQQMDAFERGRSALTVIENDLVRSYISHQSADLHSFYGTPIGMTFVGTTQMTSDPKDVNLARITYVIYNFNKMPVEKIPEPFPVLDENTEEVLGYEYPYPLLRYVEPGASDLDSFPINWDSDTVLPPFPDSQPVHTGVNFGELLNALCGFSTTSADLTKSQQVLVRSTKCEIWMRMLAGGDNGPDSDHPIPNFWRDVLGYGKTTEDQDKVHQDYVVTENVISSAWPGFRLIDPFGTPSIAGARTSSFDYDAAKAYALASPANPKPASPWWNDAHAKNWPNARLPEVVAANLWLMFSSPYPGAPDFQRLFSLEVNLPTGYTRAPEL